MHFKKQIIFNKFKFILKQIETEFECIHCKNLSLSACSLFFALNTLEKHIRESHKQVILIYQ